jgi:hypothetical protein
MTKVLFKLSGGLGNQMFQVAAAQTYSSFSGEDIECVFIDSGGSDNFARANREAFHFVNKVVGAEASLKLTKYQANNLKLRFQSKYFWEYLSFRNPMENGFVDEIFKNGSKRPLIVDGYFQSIDAVASGVEFLLKKYQQNDVCKKPFEVGFSSSTVIHIRRGDYLLKSMKDNFGLLSDSYFLKIISQNEERKILICEHKLDLGAEILQLESDGKIVVLDRSDLSAEQSLRLMGQAKELYASNSTFSLWGGLIAISNGGVVYLPKPWSKTINALGSERWGFRFLSSEFL